MHPRWVLSFFLSISCLAANQGLEIYMKQCASCHGDQGQGVADEYDEALVGKKSIASLAKYIHRSMPEGAEDDVIDEDAYLVAEYIHGAFYSPESQRTAKPIPQDLLRLTQHQHRHVLADLVSRFRKQSNLGTKNGLVAEFFNKEKMNDRKGKLIERIDEQISFDLSSNHEIKDINPNGFSIFWRGSLLPLETGNYQFRITTPNGARLWLNHLNNRSQPLIDAWVSSGNQMRESKADLFLLGGHATPIELNYISYHEKTSSITLEWKPPHGVWSPIPTTQLYPTSSPKVAICTTSFPADDASQGYERGSSISKVWKQAVIRSAIEITSLIFEDIDSLAQTTVDDKDRFEKLRIFCGQFAEYAFSRPLTEKQRISYIDTFFSQNQDDAEMAVKKSLMLILTSPYFLYPSLNKNEQGNKDLFTRASQLALALTDSIPDQDLYNAAKQGALLSEAEAQKQIERMLTDPRAKEKTQRFFLQWLHLTTRSDLTKDQEAFPNFNEVIVSELRSSLLKFIEDTVWSKNSDYRQLFQSSNLLNSPNLKKLYQEEKHQAGLLTHPYLLAAFSYHHQTSPIHRGVYLSRNVFGRFLKPPPKAIEFKDADFNPDLTMREKVTELTKDESCMSCHSIINPIGFSLENYDAIGRYRTHELNKPINTVSQYITEGDTEIKITGTSDLAKLAISSPGAHRAFIKHLFHHLVHQSTNSYGYDTMEQLYQEFRNNDFNIKHLMGTIASLTTH